MFHSQPIRDPLLTNRPISDPVLQHGDINADDLVRDIFNDVDSILADWEPVQGPSKEKARWLKGLLGNTIQPRLECPPE